MRHCAVKGLSLVRLGRYQPWAANATQGPVADNVDGDQTAWNVHSDLRSILSLEKIFLL